MVSWVETPELRRFLQRRRIDSIAESLWEESCSFFRLEKGFGFHSARPLHPLARIVEEWIASEVPLYGVRPTARFGAWLLLLPQNGKR
jgi:hypothetical protein